MTKLFEDEAVGLMKVSLDRGIFKQIDVERVSAGAHYTEDDCWLVEPVVQFVLDLVANGRNVVVDPFAGDGHMLRAICEQFGINSAVGFDLNVDKWQKNDSLLAIPPISGAFICTNPPYLAKYSARRKGVLSLVERYFSESKYEDLYLVAIERMLASGLPAVAIVPETFIASGLFRSKLERVVILERRNPFSTTDTPVCVACFDPDLKKGHRVNCYRDGELLGALESLEEGGKLDCDANSRRRLAFNVADGALALKAVDGTAPGDRIRFLRGDEFGYDVGMIKISSRLMTRIEVQDLPIDELDNLIESANLILEHVRSKTKDVVLSPFKGNNKAGIRRRRLDYRLARSIIATALQKTSKGEVRFEQTALF